MGKKANANNLFLEILVSELGEAVLGSKKIQARFRQICKMGILKDIAHQTVGFNLGDLAKEIIDDMETQRSFLQPEQSENVSEPEKPSPQNSNIDDHECPGDQGREQRISEENVVKNFVQQVDGRKLSPNEIKFQEYLEKDFDEETWLKEARIEYPVDEAK